MTRILSLINVLRVGSTSYLEMSSHAKISAHLCRIYGSQAILNRMRTSFSFYIVRITMRRIPSRRIGWKSSFLSIEMDRLEQLSWCLRRSMGGLGMWGSVGGKRKPMEVLRCRLSLIPVLKADIIYHHKISLLLSLIYYLSSIQTISS